MKTLRFAALASGGGSNLQTILNRISAGDLNAQLVFAVSNNSTAPALDKARAVGSNAFHVSTKTEGSELAVGEKLVDLITDYPVDLLILAGYMKKVPDIVLQIMRNRVINIHPALLPSFGGAGFFGQHVHEAVIQRGCHFSGITIHMVNEEYDAGQILLQRMYEIPKGMGAKDLGEAILKLEHSSYWQVLQGFSKGLLLPTPSLNPQFAVVIDPQWWKFVQANS